MATLASHQQVKKSDTWKTPEDWRKSIFGKLKSHFSFFYCSLFDGKFQKYELRVFSFEQLFVAAISYIKVKICGT